MLRLILEYGVPGIAIAGAVAAFVYLPPLLKQISVAVLICAGSLSIGLGAGIEHGKRDCDARFASITAATDAAVASEVQAAHAREALNASALSEAQDALAAFQAKSNADLARAREGVAKVVFGNKCGGADFKVPPVILKAIKGGK
jgi:hypothetical protein